MCYQLEIKPRDILFFRDGRPISGSFAGAGAAWPRPNTFHASLQAALYQQWPERQAWESPAFDGRGKRLKNGRLSKSPMRFSGLKTWGPFPAVNGEIYFPTPADVEVSGLLAPVKIPRGAVSNLPAPLKYPVGGCGKATKQKVGPWLKASSLAAYLKDGKMPDTCRDDEIYTTETRPGVAIDAETHSHVEHQFYQAEYMRLCRDVSMTAFAECEAHREDGKKTDVMDELFSDVKNMHLVFGGQQGVARLDSVRDRASIPFWKDCEMQVEGTRVKWVLLSPCLFNAGWLPDWVDPGSGAVMLRDAPLREDYDSRRLWRQALNQAPAIGAQLVAARVKGAVHFSGWSTNKDEKGELGPRQTLAAVPAGSVYYFEASDQQQARLLVKQLHGTTKSSRYGEQGFGLGVCGKWSMTG